MLAKFVQTLIATIVVATVGAACYFGGFEAGRRSATPTLAAATAPLSTNGSSADADNSQFQLFWEAWNLVEKEFYNPQAIDRQKMTYGAIKGALETLNDPYTNFASPSNAQVSEDDMRGSFDGIGIQVQMNGNKLTVIAPLEGSPGEQAGLKSGDVIAAIDGEDTSSLSLLDAVALIRGPRGTTVKLTVARDGEAQPLEIQVTRAEIKSVNVTSKDMGDGIYYVRLNSFTTPSAREVGRAVKSAADSKARGLVFDLRNNPGGLLQSGVDIASLFMHGGVVLYEETRAGQETPFYVRKGATVAPDIPMAVLINKGSASASEIVSAALQDSGRAALVGEASFGKDLIQNVHELSDTSSVRVTIARWFSPKRQEIHGVGLTPDLEVKMTADDVQAGRDPQLDAAIEYLKNKIQSQ